MAKGASKNATAAKDAAEVAGNFELALFGDKAGTVKIKGPGKKVLATVHDALIPVPTDDETALAVLRTMDKTIRFADGRTAKVKGLRAAAAQLINLRHGEALRSEARRNLLDGGTFDAEGFLADLRTPRALTSSGRRGSRSVVVSGTELAEAMASGDVNKVAALLRAAGAKVA